MEETKILIDSQPKYSVQAEFNRAQAVIMHEPSSELYYGVLHPHAALFDSYFNAAKAAKEHKQFQQLLKNRGIEVFTVKEALLKNVVDELGEPIEGKELEEFRDFARSCVRLNTPSLTGLSYDEIVEQHIYLDKVFKKMHPVDLVRTILLQPNLILKRTLTNTFVTADYNANPVMNLYFSRDQIITTGKGVVLTNLNSPQREIETRILCMCLKKIGIKPLLDLSKVNKSAHIEGGDFFMLNNIALIGEGMRSNRLAIEILMKADVIGTEQVALIKDNYHYQPQMHLDTYFNIIDKDLVAISHNRYNAGPGTKQELLVDIYVKGAASYQLTEVSIPFKKYLEDYLKVEVIVISDEDQKNYGLNFLCISPRNIIAVKGQSEDYKNKMALHNVAVEWVDFENLKQGWGAAHCTTQVINRKI
ncbi:arginine deiminase family protein [Aquimarina agarilytica]|uniref:arginine deiminase family protein n=1 Tax=Aquimarina agarilytica TaxID=1087449 RepID=UPI000289A387|nr:arginine deiminase family protein [Aquimarina agarilytica]